MSSAWGSSWGSAWGSSWGSITAQQQQLGGSDEDLIQKVLDKWETIDEIREAVVPAEEAFQALTKAPERVQKQAQRIVRKYVDSSVDSQVDWSALQASVRDSKRLLTLWREQQIQQMIHDDDEEIIMSEFF